MYDKFITNQVDFEDVLIQPNPTNISSRKETNIEKDIFGIKACPIIAANMDTVGTFNMAEALKSEKAFTALHKFYTEQEILAFLNTTNNNKYTFVTSGISKNEFSRIEKIMKDQEYCKNICVDVANGYMKSLCDFVYNLATMFPNHNILVGNVVDKIGAKALIDSGAKGIKVGIGPGAQCLTRRMTGVGRPQLSSILECAEITHKHGVIVVADGGIKTPSDYVKALAAGADLVMIGSLFGGSDESDARLVYDEEKQMYLKEIYGMSSNRAMKVHYKEIGSYKASEGRVSLVHTTGPVKNTVNELNGGLRSAMAYTNTKDIKDFFANTKFYIKSR